MKIAIIDDERPSRSELRHLVQEILPDAEIVEAENGQQALELAASEAPDVMFIDMHLGDMNGVTLPRTLRRLLPDVNIVFATAYAEYAVPAFELDAVDYILKPFDRQRIEFAIKKVLAKQQPGAAAAPQGPSIDKLSIWNDKKVTLVDIRDIAYIETDNRCCILHTRKGRFTSSQSLSFFESRLAEHNFLRIHKSYVVNLADVIEISPWFNNMYCVKLQGFENEALPVSRKQIKRIKEIFSF